MEERNGTRLDWGAVAPDARAAMLALERFVRESGLPVQLLELVKTRVSQLNGCAYCLDMHTKEARAHGEAEQRLYALAAWWEAPFYSDEERVALRWAERLTRVPHEVPDDLYSLALATFGPERLVALTAAVIAIGGWNRWYAAFRPVPVGSYTPPATPEA